MKRKGSLMGSSKYENNPYAFDKDFQDRKVFHREVLDPAIRALKTPHEITSNFIVSMLEAKSEKYKHGFLLTYGGVEAYIFNNWDRCHD